MTVSDVSKGLYEGFLHPEFDSDETINHFHTSYRERLHAAVDADAGKGGVLGSFDDIVTIPKPPYTRTRALFDGKEAIVMGLYGLDCAHDCGAELHPVYAMAIHLNENDELNDDVWAIFVKNWGDEGYCSLQIHELEPNNNLTFSFRINKIGAMQVASVPAPSSDSSGEHGTFFKTNSNKTRGPGLTPIPNEGAIVTFSLPPPSERARINGMLHLKWSIAENRRPSAIQLGSVQQLVTNERREQEDAEGLTTPLIQRLKPEQKAALEKTYENLHPPVPDEINLPALPAEIFSGTKMPEVAQTPIVKPLVDATKNQNIETMDRMLRSMAPP